MPGISDIWIAIALTVFAGLATGLGGLVSMFARRLSTRFLAFAMGLSAGVMTYISFMELLPEAYSAFEPLYGERGASVRMLLSFFGGIAIIALIDWLVPEDENPHEAHSLDELLRPDNHHLRRTGMMLALAIGIHNFPEGMATFVAALDGLDVALPIVVAIAIHLSLIHN
ncbi:MAG: zinc transporter ZupT, partial [Muribaculaceae bacterium]|nr:zinc transporter ZupT [Muribaculaceae bacterium]